MAQKRSKAQPTTPKKKFALQISRKGLGLLICLVVLICAWTFTLGVLVGRDSAPLEFDINALEKKLAELKALDIKEKLKRFKILTDDAEDIKSDLGFHEALKTTKSDIQLPDPRPEPVSDKRKPPAPLTAAVSEPKEAGVEKDTIEKREPPNQIEAVKPDSDNSQRKYTVQVASIRNLKEADKMVTRLKRKGYPAYKAIAKIPGKGIWFRIRVGPYPNKDEAQVALTELKRNKLKGFILNYN